jgi:hypothetical protein
MDPHRKHKGGRKGRVDARPLDGPALAAIGLEAEFGLVVDGAPIEVEDIIRDPRDFIGDTLTHRVGTSYHLPTGGAVYFDTGVIEVATPLIEIDRGCGMRAGRSLWEAILAVREGLSRWERRTGRRAALTGFSTHYNVSFEHPDDRPGRALDDLALLLVYILAPPVMVLATNRSSTGVGVRPRRTRIEVTADFTPSAPLMVATATLITGIVRAVMEWPAYGLDMLARYRIPTIAGFQPIPHTTRNGWLGRAECYPQNPFTTGIDDPIWTPRPARTEAPDAGARLSLRQIAQRIFQRFRWPIARVSDPLTLRFIAAVLSGRAPSLLDLPERPPGYDDVGRLCGWEPTFAPGVARSRYERVLIRALSGTPLQIGPHVLTPLGTRGWTRVVFRREHDGARQTMSLDALLPHLDAWEQREPDLR